MARGPGGKDRVQQRAPEQLWQIKRPGAVVPAVAGHEHQHAHLVLRLGLHAEAEAVVAVGAGLLGRLWLWVRELGGAALGRSPCT